MFFLQNPSTTYHLVGTPAEKQTSTSSPAKILCREDRYAVFDKDHFKNTSLPKPSTVFRYSLAITSMLAIICASYKKWVNSLARLADMIGMSYAFNDMSVMESSLTITRPCSGRTSSLSSATSRSSLLYPLHCNACEASSLSFETMVFTVHVHHRIKAQVRRQSLDTRSL